MVVIVHASPRPRKLNRGIVAQTYIRGPAHRYHSILPDYNVRDPCVWTFLHSIVATLNIQPFMCWASSRRVDLADVHETHSLVRGALTNVACSIARS